MIALVLVSPIGFLHTTLFSLISSIFTISYYLRRKTVQFVYFFDSQTSMKCGLSEKSQNNIKIGNTIQTIIQVYKRPFIHSFLFRSTLNVFIHLVFFNKENRNLFPLIGFIEIHSTRLLLHSGITIYCFLFELFQTKNNNNMWSSVETSSRTHRTTQQNIYIYISISLRFPMHSVHFNYWKYPCSLPMRRVFNTTG